MMKLCNPWGRAVRHAMVDLDMNMTDLAKALGVSRAHVSSVVNGRVISPGLIDRINDYLNLSVAYSVPVLEASDLSAEQVPLSVAELYNEPVDGLANGLYGTDETQPNTEIYADDSHLLDELW